MSILARPLPHPAGQRQRDRPAAVTALLRSDGYTGGRHRGAADYADDPWKSITRELDARVVAKGGRSLFEYRPLHVASYSR